MAELIVRHYPTLESSEVRGMLVRLYADGKRKKAAAKLEADIRILGSCWPDTRSIDVRTLRGWEPLRELRREYEGVAYRIFFVTRGKELWMLSAFEKKSDRTPRSELEKAYARMQAVLKEGP